LEGNPVLVHGGPFANIAHGCSSIISLNTALNLADYVVTEAGFASDLGAEKFLDIVCDVAKIKPNVIVLVVSIRSLKMHGGIKKNELDVINISALKKGMDNLCRHIKNISAFNIPYIISINQFINDTKQEMDYLQNFFCKNNIPFSFNTAYENGGAKGANDLAKKVVELSKKETSLKPVYKLSDKLVDKIEKICKRCYGATDVKYSDDAFKKIKEFSKFDYYVCMAKTPISLTDDEKILMITKPFTIHVKDLLIANGAKFIIVLTGNIYRMPGLPKIPEANKM
jgi:formate--tetrahydrofolate ligase